MNVVFWFIPLGFLLCLGCGLLVFISPSFRTKRMFLWSTWGFAIGLVSDHIATALGVAFPRARYDLYVFRADQYLGSPSFVVGQFFLGRPHWRFLLIAVYWLLSIAVILLMVYREWLRLSQFVAVMAFLLNVVIAPLIYILFPVCGPAFAFHRFPLYPHPAAIVPIMIPSAPNGVPSVHASTVFLIVYFAWKTRARIPAIIFMVLTLLATLAMGEHYSIDLILAVPYAAMVIYIAKFSVRWRYHFPNPSA